MGDNWGILAVNGFMSILQETMVFTSKYEDFLQSVPSSNSEEENLMDEDLFGQFCRQKHPKNGACMLVYDIPSGYLT